MKALTILLVTATAGMASWTVARSSPVTPSGQEEEPGGPDSARVVAFFATLRTTDPMLCDMVTDQLGNFWTSGGREGVGQLSDGRRTWEPIRDSLFSPVSAPAARRMIAGTLGDPSACVRRAAAKMLGRSGESAL